MQQFDDFKIGLNFVAQQSGCVTVSSAYGHICELFYHVTCFGDIAYLILVFSFCARGVISPNISPNVDGHIRK